jgi:hypothetical protein
MFRPQQVYKMIKSKAQTHTAGTFHGGGATPATPTASNE